MILIYKAWGGGWGVVTSAYGFLTCSLLYGVVGALYIISIHLLPTLST